MEPDRMHSTYKGPNDQRRTTEPSWEAEWDLPNGLTAVLMASADQLGYWKVWLILYAGADYENNDDIVIVDGNRATIKTDEYGSTTMRDPEDGEELAGILRAWSELEVVR
jgi:hypothetical protein